MAQQNSACPLEGSQLYFHTPTNVSKQGLFYPICLGDFVCDGDYLVHRNRYDSFLIMYIESGEGFLDFEGNHYELKANDLVFLDCYLPHTYGAYNFWHIEWIHFDGVTAREYYSLFHSRHGCVLPFQKTAANSVLKPLRTLLTQFSEKKHLSEVWLSKYLTDLLTYTLEFSQESAMPAAVPGLTEQIRHNIQIHFQQPLSVKALAESLSLNPSYLIRRFKKETGMTPYQYLTCVRIERAQYELTTTNRSVKEIGLSCGYQSENSFCITFRKETGMTPTQFRKKPSSVVPVTRENLKKDEKTE